MVAITTVEVVRLAFQSMAETLFELSYLTKEIALIEMEEKIRLVNNFHSKCRMTCPMVKLCSHGPGAIANRSFS
jgi:hypothetical protein